MSPGGIKANLYATAQLFAILPNARQSAAENSAVNSENADTISIDSWESDSSDDAENAVRTSRTLVLSYFFRGLQGDSGILTRNTNMVHVLGNFSVLSCVDKRGILAQPMPTPETLFTFTDITVEKTEKASNDSKMENGWSDDDEVSTSTPPPSLSPSPARFMACCWEELGPRDRSAPSTPRARSTYSPNCTGDHLPKCTGDGAERHSVEGSDLLGMGASLCAVC